MAARSGSPNAPAGPRRELIYTGEIYRPPCSSGGTW